MQLPSVDRFAGARPSGADLASTNGAKVIPLPPVNPAVTANAPGVVNKIGDGAALANNVNAPYSSVSDPALRGSEAATGSRD